MSEKTKGLPQNHIPSECNEHWDAFCGIRGFSPSSLFSATTLTPTSTPKTRTAVLLAQLSVAVRIRIRIDSVANKIVYQPLQPDSGVPVDEERVVAGRSDPNLHLGYFQPTRLCISLCSQTQASQWARSELLPFDRTRTCTLNTSSALSQTECGHYGHFRLTFEVIEGDSGVGCEIGSSVCQHCWCEPRRFVDVHAERSSQPTSTRALFGH